MGLWATWPSAGSPCPWEVGENYLIFKVLSNPNHSLILWFCVTVMMGMNMKQGRDPGQCPLLTRLQTRTPLYQTGLKQVCNSGHLHCSAFSSPGMVQTVAIGREEHKVSWGHHSSTWELHHTWQQIPQRHPLKAFWNNLTSAARSVWFSNSIHEHYFTLPLFIEMLYCRTGHRGLISNQEPAIQFWSAVLW